MKVATLIILCCIMAAGAFGQTQKGAKMAPGSLNCRTCHSTDSPTKEKPSLVKCPRMMIKGYHSIEEGPESITMDEISNLYGPVKFSHRSHAHMAEMGDGCYGCHHYNQARPIQECKECHSASRIRTDLGKPDLKGARHRQCVDCHLQWSHTSDCNSCHAKKRGDGSGAAAQDRKAFPKVVIPARKVYETSSVKGKLVTFMHNDHAERFGLKCIDCHQEQTCVGCHDVKKAGQSPATASVAKRSGSMEELHKKCFACHATNSCTSCHMDRAREAFDHSKSTGWALNRFHSRLGCRQCHTTSGKFVQLNTDCETCHKGWQKKFSHAKTGLALDETHGGLDCESCHVDGNFTVRPSCVSCHQDKSYPKSKPGKTVLTAVTKK
jgi:Class III cytochrome C family